MVYTSTSLAAALVSLAAFPNMGPWGAWSTLTGGSMRGWAVTEVATKIVKSVSWIRIITPFQVGGVVSRTMAQMIPMNEGDYAVACPLGLL